MMLKLLFYTFLLMNTSFVNGLPYLWSGIICLVSLTLYFLLFLLLRILTLCMIESYDAWCLATCLSYFVVLWVRYFSSCWMLNPELSRLFLNSFRTKFFLLNWLSYIFLLHFSCSLPTLASGFILVALFCSLYHIKAFFLNAHVSSNNTNLI